MRNLDSILKSRDITLPAKVHLVKTMVFLGVMYGCKSWTIKNGPKNWCFRIVVLEKTLVSPLDSKEIKPVNPNGNQPSIFTGRTEAEAETPILWPDAKSRLIWKDPDAEKDWGQEKRATEDEMVGWHHRLNEYEFKQAPGVCSRTGRPDMLQCMGSQRVGHDWATELNWV